MHDNDKRQLKIIQIQVCPSSNQIFALTEDGKIFYRVKASKAQPVWYLVEGIDPVNIKIHDDGDYVRT